MNLIINAGSGEIPSSGKGWKNTYPQSKMNAFEYFYKPMLEQGITDITVKDTGLVSEGRWIYDFTHTVTGKTVRLEIDGIDNMEAYMAEHIFGARTYWNGSSSSIVELSDFAVDGYKPYMTFVKES